MFHGVVFLASSLSCLESREGEDEEGGRWHAMKWVSERGCCFKLHLNRMVCGCLRVTRAKILAMLVEE